VATCKKDSYTIVVSSDPSVQNIGIVEPGDDHREIPGNSSTEVVEK
jgi:hypothetical protein